MTDDTSDKPSEPAAGAGESDETKRLLEEVTQLGEESDRRAEKEKAVEEIKNRVSIAAIILTTALSFIGNIRSNRDSVVNDAKSAASEAEREAAELWAFYQTGQAERTNVELAYDQIRLDLRRRGVTIDDPSAKLETLKLVDYEQRIRDFDIESRRVFYRVQDLEEEKDRALRSKRSPARASTRYDLGGKLITLALILLSVTILSNRRWLFWGGVTLGAAGVLVALNGYFLFF